jgi:gamma-glutamylcyclotransferase (GGCT)/AIG2-like uncharacterized protein YtfP
VPTVNVFTYGSLMFAPVWDKVCAGRYPTRKMTLKNFQRYCVEGESYPALVPQIDGSVEGLVYLGVSQADQQRLNQFEGDEYKLRTQALGNSVNSLDDGLVVCFYEYVVLERLDRRDWSPSEFEKSGLPLFLARHVGSFLENGRRSS